jgi:hypothetical protein
MRYVIYAALEVGDGNFFWVMGIVSSRGAGAVNS